MVVAFCQQTRRHGGCQPVNVGEQLLYENRHPGTCLLFFFFRIVILCFTQVSLSQHAENCR